MVVAAAASDHHSSTKNAAAAAGNFKEPKSKSKSHVVLRVDNYLYEKKKNNNNTPKEDLKMVLQQEVREEDDGSSISDSSNGDDDGGDNSTDTKLSQKSKTTTTTFQTHIHNPLRRYFATFWGRLDEMDRMIWKSTVPLAALTCMLPVVQTSDLFWVNQLQNALAVSSQQAANMVYQFSFGLFSFLPAVTATLVSKHYASGDIQGTQQVIGLALSLATIASAIVSLLLFFNPSRFLKAVLNDGNPALSLSIPYLRIRCLSLIPQMISFVAFSAFRGTMDLKSCVKISVISNALNMALTPILIHVLKLGISGSALTALICDCFNALCYMKLMKDRHFLVPSQIFKVPTWKTVAPIVKGSTLQVKSFALLFTNLLVTRKVQSFDDNGVSPAAYALAMQTFFLGSVVIFAMGMAIQTLYPTAVSNSPDHHRSSYKRTLVSRLLSRGVGVGLAVSVIQMLLAPGILRSTPLPEVRKAATVPILIVVAFQAVIGLTSVGDGIIIGSGKFALSSALQVIASLAYIACLQLTPQSMGLNGVFLCLGAFTVFRLVGVLTVLPAVVKDDEQDEYNLRQSTNSTTLVTSAT